MQNDLSVKLTHLENYIRKLMSTEESLYFHMAPDISGQPLSAISDPHVHKGWELKLLNSSPASDGPPYWELVPPNQLHAGNLDCHFSIESNRRFLCIGFRRVIGYINCAIPESLTLWNNIPEFFTILERIPEAERGDALRSQILHALLHNLLLIFEQLGSIPEQRAPQNIFNAALNYLNSYYYQSFLSVGDVAAAVGVSQQYLSRLFQLNNGCSTRQTLIHIRLQHAQEMLESGYYLVKDVAQLTGWTSYFYFCSAYKSHFGHPPSAVREK